VTPKNGSVDKIMALLWEGETSKARLAIKEAKASAQQKREDGRALMAAADDELSRLNAITPSDWHDSETKTSKRREANISKTMEAAASSARRRLNKAARLTPTQKQTRAVAVLRAAKRVAAERGPEIMIDDVAKAIAEEGVDMSISHNRVNTAIGNIIGRTDDFQIVRKGVYRLQQPKLTLNDT